MMFTEKYKPKQLGEIIGQKEPLNQIQKAFRDIKKSKKKTFLFCCGIGNGKTSTAHCIAHDFDYEIVEINASDFRNKEEIEKLQEGFKQRSLFGKKKLLLVDELEGLSGTQDRGAIPELLRLITCTSFPVIFTCKDQNDEKFRSLKKASSVISFRAIDINDVYTYLKHITKKENLNVDSALLHHIAHTCNGDLRSALNDIESVGKHTSVENLDTRDKKISIHDALNLVFNSQNEKTIVGAYENTDVDLDDVFLWLEENIPQEIKKNDLHVAFERLSRADVFRRRIIRWQYYRYLLYENVLLSAGISLAKKEKGGAKNYSRNSRLLKIWITNQKNIKRGSITKKMSRSLHCSKKEFIKNYLPYVKMISKTKMGEDFSKEFKFDAEEFAYLRR